MRWSGFSSASAARSGAALRARPVRPVPVGRRARRCGTRASQGVGRGDLHPRGVVAGKAVAPITRARRFTLIISQRIARWPGRAVVAAQESRQASCRASSASAGQRGVAGGLAAQRGFPARQDIGEDAGASLSPPLALGRVAIPAAPHAQRATLRRSAIRASGRRIARPLAALHLQVGGLRRGSRREKGEGETAGLVKARAAVRRVRLSRSSGGGAREGVELNRGGVDALEGKREVDLGGEILEALQVVVEQAAALVECRRRPPLRDCGSRARPGRRRGRRSRRRAARRGPRRRGRPSAARGRARPSSWSGRERRRRHQGEASHRRGGGRQRGSGSAGGRGAPLHGSAGEGDANRSGHCVSATAGVSVEGLRRDVGLNRRDVLRLLSLRRPGMPRPEDRLPLGIDAELAEVLRIPERLEDTIEICEIAGITSASVPSSKRRWTV